MGSKGKDGSGSGSHPKGVRGPGGPNAGRPAPRPAAPTGRSALEQWSLPLLTRLHRMPRWIIVVAPAALLLLGLLLRDSWAWLGGLVLTLVWAFLAWLTALSWPALSPGSRFVRGVVVVAFGAIVVLKFLGRF